MTHISALVSLAHFAHFEKEKTHCSRYRGLIISFLHELYEECCMWSTWVPVVYVARSLVFYVMFCRSLFVLVPFLWLHCLSFFDVRPLIIYLFSLSFSCLFLPYVLCFQLAVKCHWPVVSSLCIIWYIVESIWMK